MSHLLRIFLLLAFSSIYITASHSQRAPRINVIKTTLGPVDSNFGSGSVAAKRPGHTTQLITNTHNNTKDARFDESTEIQYAQFLVEFNQPVRGVAIIDSRRRINGGHDPEREGISFLTNAFHFEYFSYENRGYTIDIQPYVLPTRECLVNQFSTAQLAAFDARFITTAPSLICDKWIVYGSLGTFGPGGTATMPTDKAVIYLRVSPDHTIASRRGTGLTSLSPLVEGLPHHMFIDNAGEQARDYYDSGAHLRVIELARADNYPRRIDALRDATNDLPAVEYTSDDVNTRLVRTRLQWKLSYNRPVLISTVTSSDFTLSHTPADGSSVAMSVAHTSQSGGYARSFIVTADVVLPNLVNDIELRYSPDVNILGAESDREYDDIRFYRPNSDLVLHDTQGNRVTTNESLEGARYSISISDNTPVEFVNYPSPAGVNSPIHRVCNSCSDDSRGYNPNDEKITTDFDGSSQEVHVFKWRMRFSEPIQGKSGDNNDEIDVNDFQVTVNDTYNSAHGIKVVSLERHSASENFDYIITAYSPVASYGQGNALSDGDILGMSLKSDAFITDNTGNDANKLADTNFAHPFGESDYWTSTYELVTEPFEVVSIERHNSVNEFVPLDGSISWDVTLSRPYHENTDFDLAGAAFGIRIHDGTDDRWVPYHIFRTIAEKIPGTNTKVRVTAMPFNRTNNNNSDRRRYGSTGVIRLVADRYLNLVHNPTGDLFTGSDGARLETPVAPTTSETYDLDFDPTTLTGITLVNDFAPKIDAESLSWKVQFSGNIETDTLPDASNFIITHSQDGGGSYQPLDSLQLDISGNGDTYTVSVASIDTDLLVGDRVRLSVSPLADIVDSQDHLIVWQNLSAEYRITSASVNERILSDTITSARTSNTEVVFTIVFITDNGNFDPPTSAFTVTKVSDDSVISGTRLEIDNQLTLGTRQVYNLIVPYDISETSELSLNYVEDSLVRPKITGITRSTPTAAFTSATDLTWGITFEDDIIPTTITPDAFAVLGTDVAPTITVSRVGTSSTWNIQASGVSVSGDVGQVILSLSGLSTITDGFNNSLEEDFDFTTASYTLDTAGPTIVSVVPDTGLSQASQEGLSWTVTFSEPVATFTGVTISGYDNPPTPTIEAVGTSATATQWRITTISGGTISGGTTADVLPIFTAATFTDAATNEQSSRSVPTVASTYTYDVDTAMTAGTIVRVGATLGSSSTVDWTLTFNRSVDSDTVQPSDFTPSGLLVSGSGTTYTLTATVVSGASVTLGLDPNAAFTDSRNVATADPVITDDHETYTYDGVAPTIISVSRADPPNVHSTNLKTFTWAVEFDSDIDPATINEADFVVTGANTNNTFVITDITRPNANPAEFIWRVKSTITATVVEEFELGLTTGHTISDNAGNSLATPTQNTFGQTYIYDPTAGETTNSPTHEISYFPNPTNLVLHTTSFLSPESLAIVSIVRTNASARAGGIPSLTNKKMKSWLVTLNQPYENSGVSFDTHYGFNPRDAFTVTAVSGRPNQVEVDFTTPDDDDIPSFLRSRIDSENTRLIVLSASIPRRPLSVTGNVNEDTYINDTTPPTILRIIRDLPQQHLLPPDSGQTQLKYSVYFSESVDPTTVSAADFAIVDDAGTEISNAVITLETRAGATSLSEVELSNLNVISSRSYQVDVSLPNTHAGIATLLLRDNSGVRDYADNSALGGLSQPPHEEGGDYHIIDTSPLELVGITKVFDDATVAYSMLAWHFEFNRVVSAPSTTDFAAVFTGSRSVDDDDIEYIVKPVIEGGNSVTTGDTARVWQVQVYSATLADRNPLNTYDLDVTISLSSTADIKDPFDTQLDAAAASTTTSPKYDLFREYGFYIGGVDLVRPERDVSGLLGASRALTEDELATKSFAIQDEFDDDRRNLVLQIVFSTEMDISSVTSQDFNFYNIDESSIYLGSRSITDDGHHVFRFFANHTADHGEYAGINLKPDGEFRAVNPYGLRGFGFTPISSNNFGGYPLVGVWSISTQTPFVRSVQAFWHKDGQDCTPQDNCRSHQRNNRLSDGRVPIGPGDYITWSINFNDNLDLDVDDFVVEDGRGNRRPVELTVRRDSDAHSYFSRCENPANCWDITAKISTRHNNYFEDRYNNGNAYDLLLASDIQNSFGDTLSSLTPSSPSATNDLRVRVDTEGPRLDRFATYEQATGRPFADPATTSSLRPRWRFIFSEPVRSSSGGYAITAENIILNAGVPADTEVIVSPPTGFLGAEYYLALQLPEGFTGTQDIGFTIDLSDISDTAGNEFLRSAIGRCTGCVVPENYMSSSPTIKIDRSVPEILGVTASGETGTGPTVTPRSSGTAPDIIMVDDVTIGNNIVYDVWLNRKLHSASDAKLTISNSDGRTTTTSEDNLSCVSPCDEIEVPNSSPSVMGYQYSVTVPVDHRTRVGMQTVTISSPTYDEYGNLINPDGDTYVPSGVFVHDSRPFTVTDIVRGYHSSNIVEINNLFVTGFNGAVSPREEHETTASWRITLSEAVVDPGNLDPPVLGVNDIDGVELVVTNPDGTPFDYAANPGTFPPTLIQFFCYARSCSAVADLRPLYFNHDFNVSIRFTDSIRLRRASIPESIATDPNTPASIIDLAYLQVPNSDSGSRFDPRNFQYEVNNSGGGTVALGVNVNRPLLVASVAKNPVSNEARISPECELFRVCSELDQSITTTPTTTTTTPIIGSQKSSSSVTRVGSGDVVSITVASIHGNLRASPSIITINGVTNPAGGRWLPSAGTDLGAARGYRYEFTVTDIFPFHDGPLEVSIGGYSSDGSFINGDVFTFDTSQGSVNPNNESIALGSFEIVRPLQLLMVSSAEPNVTPETIQPEPIPDTSVDPFSLRQLTEPTTEYRLSTNFSFLWRIQFNRPLRSIFNDMFVVSSAQSFPPDEPDEGTPTPEPIEPSVRCVRFTCPSASPAFSPAFSPSASPTASPSASPFAPQFTQAPPPPPAMSSFAPLPATSHTLTAMQDPNDPNAVIVTVMLSDPTSIPDHTTLMVGLSQQAPIQDAQGNFPTTSNAGQQLVTLVQALPSTNISSPLDGNNNIIDHTYSLIRSFVTRRADQILTNIPDLSDRLNRGVTGGFTRTNNFTASIDDFGSNINLDGVFRLDMSDIFKVEDTEGWLETDYSSVEGDDGATTSTLFVKGGIDYSIQENIIAGLLFMFDWSSEDGGDTPLDPLTTTEIAQLGFTGTPPPTTGTASSTIEGTGWLVGPYLVADFDPNVQFEAKLAWGGSSNTIKPFDTYETDFETSRFLLSAGFSSSGSSGASGWAITPAIDYLYYQEEVDEFRDGLAATTATGSGRGSEIPTGGNAIPSIEYGVHRVEFGPTFSKARDLSSGEFNTVIGVTGVWYEGETESNGVPGDVEDFNARINLRFDYLGDSGINLNFGGYYGGLGGDYSSYGLTVGMTTKF